ncbi:uncharacterized protein LOC119728145 [Patiria miniata]|uniref:Uncharacterized protein n=1 Tax=Patiria miniata TaxID=46514 RepID=A0A913ZXU9_PATMI|nr:uncharacterized protein LOC119728145 [Patiria miniata]
MIPSKNRRNSMGFSKVRLCVALLLAWTSFNMTFLPSVKAASELSKRYYPCDDLASAAIQIVLDNLRPEPVQSQLISLSNQYRGTTLSYPMPDWKILRVFKKLDDIRDLHSQVDSFISTVSIEINRDVVTLEQNCKSNTLGKRLGK